MLKKALLILCLIFTVSLLTLAAQDNNQNPPTSTNPTSSSGSANPTNPANPANPASTNALDKFVKLDDVAILRLLYPKETFTYKSTEQTEASGQHPLEQNYQVGEAENHKIAVLGRTLGKFTQSETQELLAMISIDNPSGTPYKSGVYAVLLRLDDGGGAELIAKPSNLYRSSATNKLWKPALITDVNFDKQEEIVMLEGEKKDVNVYKIYTWDNKSKDFSLVSSHPLQTLLSFYANLNAAVSLGIENEQSAGNSELSAAYEKLSPKMQGQQSTDVLRSRLKATKKVEVNSLKLLIKSEISALVRIQYRLVDNDGFSQTYEGDYQIKRYNEDWQIDSERLKSVGLAK